MAILGHSVGARRSDRSNSPRVELTQLCAPLGAPGGSWALLEAPGRSCALLGAPGRSWALLGAPERFWTLLGAPKRSWTLLDAPGRIPALPRRVSLLQWRTFKRMTCPQVAPGMRRLKKILASAELASDRGVSRLCWALLKHLRAISMASWTISVSVVLNSVGVGCRCSVVFIVLYSLMHSLIGSFSCIAFLVMLILIFIVPMHYAFLSYYYCCVLLFQLLFLSLLSLFISIRCLSLRFFLLIILRVRLFNIHCWRSCSSRRIIAIVVRSVVVVIVVVDIARCSVLVLHKKHNLNPPSLHPA